MTPIPSTPETRRREIIERATYIHGNTEMTNAAREAASVVVALGPDADADAINANPYTFWRVAQTETCCGCGAEADRVVTVGDDPKAWGTWTTTLCRPCLVVALAALDAAP